MISLFDPENTLLIRLICEELEEMAINLEKENHWTFSKRLIAIKDELRIRCLEEYDYDAV